MKLYKALKLKKKLIGEISALRSKIQEKNSYAVGSLNPDNYNVPNLYRDLNEKINSLVDLKVAINSANIGIRDKIFVLSELKALISMLKVLPTTEGIHPGGGFRGEVDREYKAQFSEAECDAMVIGLQDR